MKQSAIERLKQLRADLSATQAYPWKNMETWIAKALPFVRTVLPEHLEDFKCLSEAPKWMWRPAYLISDGYSNIDEPTDIEDDNNSLSEEAKKKLLAWIDGMIVSAEEPVSQTIEPVMRVRNILDRIPSVVRVLSNRRTGREPLILNDEYDLQYLLHALLAVEFRDIRPEEWTPSYAGSASRTDFLIKREKIVVEVKYVRPDHNDRKIADELIIDKERYIKHPECSILVCFVYDPSKTLKNPEALQNDLSCGSPLTEVIVRPIN